jgi:predicted O-methyltransferase YrrM
LSFIDADKASNAAYLEHAIALSRPGALIIVDNVVRQGEVLDASSTDPNVIGTRKVLTLLGSHPRLHSTALQTVGLKGHDGFAAAIVLP